MKRWIKGILSGMVGCFVLGLAFLALGAFFKADWMQALANNRIISVEDAADEGITVWVGGLNTTLGKLTGQTQSAQELFVPSGFLGQIEVSGKKVKVEIDQGEAFALKAQDIPTEYIKSSLHKGTWEIKVDSKAGADGVLYLTLPAGETMEQVELKTETGSIHADSIHTQKMEIEAGLGQVVVDDLQAVTLKVESDMGEVDLTGNVASYVELETDMGQVKLTMPKPARYSWECKTESGMGAIHLFGADVADRGSYDGEQSNGNSGDWVQFELETEMGSIEIQE